MTMENNTLTRAALGSSASLGDLYDARCDEFCGISIFKSAIPDGVIDKIDDDFSDITVVQSDSFSEKAAKLEVNPELQVSILAGLCKLSGAGQYLQNRKLSTRTVKSSLVFNIKTETQKFSVYHQDLKECFSLDAIKTEMSTHVVVGISYGANSVLSCSYQNRENEKVSDIEHKLGDELKKTVSVNGNGKVKVQKNDKLLGMTLEIHVFGDILAKGCLPTTIDAALEFIAQVPSMLEQCNNGKGKPLMYHLFPIRLLQKYLKFSAGADLLITSLQEESLTRAVHIVEDIMTVQRLLHDFHQDCLEHRKFVKQSDLNAVGALQKEVKIQESAFRAQLSLLLRKIRAGECDVDKLSEFLQEFQSSCWSPEAVTGKVGGWTRVSDKIHFGQYLVQLGVRYIGNGDSLERELLQNYDAISTVLYFTQNAKVEERERWLGNQRLFLNKTREQSEGNTNIFIAVDCDIHPNLNVRDHQSCIQTVQFNTVIQEDMLSAETSTSALPLRSPPFLESGSELNILVLGEPDRGRCEWVNGFANYFTYNSLLDAEAGELVALVPSKINGKNEEGEDILVETGISEGVFARDGASVNRQDFGDIQVLSFSHGNTVIRLIGGFKEEGSAFSSLELMGFTLRHFGKINGICIFERNNGRLDENLKEELKNLYSYLPPTGRQNICFCFTNTGGSSFPGGNGVRVLKKLFGEMRGDNIVSPKSVYSFDTEPFQYLAARKYQSSIQFSRERQQSVSSSWQRSVDETKRLLGQLQSIPPVGNDSRLLHFVSS